MSWLPRARALACRSWDSRYSRLARAPAVASGLPPKVEMELACTASTRSGRPATPPMARPLPRPLAKVSRSGVMPWAW